MCRSSQEKIKFVKINKTGSMDIKKLIGEATEYDKKEMLES